MGEQQPPAPAAEGDVIEGVLTAVCKAEYGENFDYLMPDPTRPSSWIAVLKDGTTSPLQIHCIRRVTDPADPVTGHLSLPRVRHDC